MSQAPPIPTPRVESGGETRTVDFDRFVDGRIRRTRAAVKATEIALAVAKLLAAGLVLLLVASVLEHWVVPGGFGSAERIGLFAIAVIGAGAYAARRIAPVALRRVNPLYAAAEIEREAPGLKNTLVNLLQLRSDGATSAGVKRTLERQAAERLATSPEATVDRAALVRVGYVLLALVGVVGLYVVLSPKDLFATAARVAMPWAEIAAPTRVRIADLQPGATSVSQGVSLDVSAWVTGLAEGDAVELVYSTPDGRTVDRRLPMLLDDSGLRHRVLLTGDGGLGLQTGVRYRVAAGDARTPVYEVRVLASPTIAPIRVAYDYPDYTGYADRVADGVGDVSAIEGTRVTITAEANLPIESAQLDVDADGRPDTRMKVDRSTAVGRLTLRREANSGVATRDSVYVLRFTSLDGQANSDPARYRFEVTPDLAPEATILEPRPATVDVPLDGEVKVEVEARDPDFALKSVKLLGEARGRRVLDEPLLDGRSGDGHRGRFTGRAVVAPSALSLSAGDVVTYWVEAVDNRSPDANRVVTSRKRLRIVEEERRRPEDANGEPNRDGTGEPSQGGGAGADGESAPGAGEQAGEPSPDGPPGDSGEAAGAEQGPGGAGDQQPPSDAEQPQPPGGEAGDSSSGDGQQDQPGQQQNGQEQAGEQTPGEEQPGQPPSGDGLRGPGEADPNAAPNGEGGAPGENPPSEGGEAGAGDAANRPSAGAQGERRPGQPTGGPSRQVANDGSDDGSAFEQLREHFAEQEGERAERSEGGGAKRDRVESDDPGGDASDGRLETTDERAGDADAGLQERDAPGPSPDRPGVMPDRQPGVDGEQRDASSSESGGAGPEENSTETKQTDSPREGTGDAGQNQAADEGAGQSGDRGAGDASGQSGDEQLADRPTGRSSGDRRGNGTESAASDSRQDDAAPEGERDQSGAESGEGSTESSPNDPAGRPGESSSNGSAPPSDRPDGDQPAKEPPQDGALGEGGAAQRGAARDGDRPTDSAAATPAAGGDEANLEYARKQTDLVLERLSEQLERDAVDREMLDKLGWSEEDLRRFVARWRERQDRAARGGETGEAELDDALRSLGLGARGPSARGKFETDTLRDLKERPRSPVPPALRERLRSFNRGVTQSGDQD